MSILDIFRRTKDEVSGPRVFVCSIDHRFDDLLKEDSEVYSQFYPATTTVVLHSIEAVSGRLEKYDILHLMCDVTESGTIKDDDGHEISGTDLIQRCCEQNVKLLWIASDNLPERYIKGFGARGKRLNLVMTLKRKGSNFPNFLQKLLSKMARGETMPVAWNDICSWLRTCQFAGVHFLRRAWSGEVARR